MGTRAWAVVMVAAGVGLGCHGGHRGDSGHLGHGDGGGAGEVLDGRAGPTDGGSFTVAWAPSPDPIALSEEFDLAITVADAGGGPPAGARLGVDATMPAHGHGMPVLPTVSEQAPGQFLAEGLLFQMAGGWVLELVVETDTAIERASFAVDCCG